MAAKYTTTWTQRAKMNPVDQDLADAIAADAKSGKITIESIAARKAPSQLGILASLWGAAMKARMPTAGDAPLAEDILYKLATSIRKYRAKAYPLSDRQVQVIWNHLAQWLGLDGKTW